MWMPVKRKMIIKRIWKKRKFNKSRAKFVNSRYFEFHIHLSEDLRFMWANSPYKFYPRNSLRMTGMSIKYNRLVKTNVLNYHHRFDSIEWGKI